MGAIASLPIRHTLTISERIAGAEDEMGEVGYTWQTRDWPVHGYGPATSDEAVENGRVDRVTDGLSVYAPAHSAPPGPGDRVVVEGIEYEVDGPVADWTHGPWKHPTAGLVVHLKRVTG